MNTTDSRQIHIANWLGQRFGVIAVSNNADYLHLALCTLLVNMHCGNTYFYYERIAGGPIQYIFNTHFPIAMTAEWQTKEGFRISAVVGAALAMWGNGMHTTIEDSYVSARFKKGPMSY